MATTKIAAWETGHEDMVHDAQLDYYGKKLATASSDRTIRIFDIAGDKQTFVAHLKGHDGPVWQAVWAHPKFGTLLASCSYDGKVLVWKEQSPGAWIKIFQDMKSPPASVNAISWAPHSFGLCLAAASSDGTVSVFTYQDNGSWDRKNFEAHKGGVNAVSWGPDMKSGALLAPSGGAVQFSKRFVTAGCDNRVKIWRYQDQEQRWSEEKVWQDEDDNKHGDWVRDAAWAPSLGLPSSTIATCSEDKTVIIWTEDRTGVWKRSKVLKFPRKCWRVSWSIMGNILAVSQGDNKVSLWKETVDGEWKNLSEIQEKEADKKEEGKSATSE